jgi:class 3 adenylate cyclase
MDEATPDATGATRPFDVLIEWAQGENMASIAKTFLLHERTVEDNLKEALATYHVRTRAEAAALLSKLGIGRRSERPHAARSVFLFTDIVDSTPINVRLGDALWAQVVGIHDAQIRDSVERYGGRVIKTIGDGTFAAFSSVESAIRASQAIQAQPAFYVPGHPEVRVVDRIGVHAGSAVAVEHDYLGLAVTVTSRLCGLAEGKQILLSESVRRALPHALTPSLVDRGKVGLKGLAGRLRIFELPAQVHM